MDRSSLGRRRQLANITIAAILAAIAKRLDVPAAAIQKAAGNRDPELRALFEAEAFATNLETIAAALGIEWRDPSPAAGPAGDPPSLPVTESGATAERLGAVLPDPDPDPGEAPARRPGRPRKG